MSTRSQVIFMNEEGDEIYPICIYRHSDGYPHGEHGVLHSLMPLLKDFKKYRGFYDVNYIIAQIAYEFVKIGRDSNDEYIQELQLAGQIDSIESAKRSRYLGVGVEPFNVEEGFHGDVAYVYLVGPDTVQVRDSNEKFLKNLKHIRIGLLAEHKIGDWTTPDYKSPEYQKENEELYG